MLLIISRSKRVAEARANIFRYVGLLAYGATPTEALSEVSMLYHAILIISPETLADPKSFVHRLKEYSPSPIFALYESKDNTPYIELFDGAFGFDDNVYMEVYTMATLAQDRDLPFLGDYRLAGIRAIVSDPVVTYFEIPIDFTKTERRLLCYLMRMYPYPANAKSIIKHIYHTSKHPEETAVRAHISSINRKFKERFERYIISHIQSNGYVIRTPELFENP